MTKARSGVVTHVPELFNMPRRRIMDLWLSLDPPNFEEMDGEYAAHLLDQGDRFTNIFSNSMLSLPVLHGLWLGKAFTPADGYPGHGYNMFRSMGNVVRKYRMKTGIVPSRFDSRPCFELHYATYRNLCGFVHMVDEVRKVGNGLYLGIGTWGFTEKQRNIPLPFLLTGPMTPFSRADRQESG
ncbi:MAG: hypothetical protein ACLFOY_13755 [Desulfatibacillaceae bacterium]